MFELLLIIAHHYKKNPHRDRATVSGWKQHTCAHCGCRYRYRMERTKRGGETTPEAARLMAEENARHAMKVQSELRPCPTCGSFQPDMVASRRTFFHTIIFVGVVATVACCGWGLIPATFITEVAVSLTWVAVVLGAASFIAHFLVDARNPNRNLQENYEVAQIQIDNGTLVAIQAGDELTAREPPAETAWRPVGQWVLHGVMFTGLLLIPAGEVLRLANGWPVNRGCEPIMVGPSERVHVNLHKTINSAGNHW